MIPNEIDGSSAETSSSRLSSHLSRLGCPSTGRPSQGIVHWTIPSSHDLFGATHTIRLEFSDHQFRVTRETTVPEKVDPVENWFLEVQCKFGACRRTECRGELFSDVAGRLPLSDCLRQIRAAVRIMGQPHCSWPIASPTRRTARSPAT